MHRFILVAALLGLTACGGELLPEESQAPMSTEEAMPAQVAAPGAEQVSSEAICLGAPVECFCKSFKTEVSCRTASPTCLWSYSRCSPAYE
ncbi:hypothetical protein POL68_39820 [Stigmatella sp. ncwal1]|uniref:Lipoprotein n=1 Tax=Stigmatella ashevillensis TaxID=2995309 RepID=A0ABT5DND4_9BACT|nr:hypothetical protein [Stigmatella ashevillena]MDC0714665.1 hypothetical protein [Stigmatella ashevillena]